MGILQHGLAVGSSSNIGPRRGKAHRGLFISVVAFHFLMAASPSIAQTASDWDAAMDGAQAAKRAGDMEKSLRLAKTAERIARAEGRPSYRLSLALVQQADTLTAFLRYDEAEAVLVEAQRVTEAVGGPKSQPMAVVLNLRSRVRFYQSDFDGALRLLRRAISISEASGNEDALATYLENLARIQLNLKDFSGAERSARRAIEILESKRSPDLTQQLRTLAIALRAQGDGAGAESALRRALTIDQKRSGGANLWTAADHAQLGDLYSGRGQQEAALESLLTALATRESLIPSNQPRYGIVAQNLEAIAACYVRLDRPLEAVPLYQRAVDIRDRIFGQTSLEAGIARLSLAEVLFDLGDLADALKTAQVSSEALRAGRASGSVMQRARLLLGKILMKTNSRDYQLRGKKVLEQLAASQRAEGNLGAYGETLQVLGAACMLVQDKACAMSSATAALENQRKLFGEPTIEVVSALRTLAVSAYWFKDYSKAVEYFSESLRDFEALAARNPRYTHYKNTHTFLDSLWEAGPHSAKLPLSFRVAQRTRQSTAALALTRVAERLSVDDPAIVEILRQSQDLEHARKLLTDDISKVASGGDDPGRSRRLDNLKGELDRVVRQQTATRAKLRKAIPGYEAVSAPPPLELAEAKRFLREDEALVAFNFGYHGGFVWVITQAGSEWSKVPLTRDELAVEVAALRQGLDIAGPSARALSLVTAPSDRRLEGIPAFDLERSHRLYEKLFSSVEKRLRSIKHVLLVPTAALTSLPPAVLVTERPSSNVGAASDYQNAAWLIRERSVTILPSVASLKHLRAQSRSTARGREVFLGVGDPLVRDFRKLASGASCPTPEVRAQVSALGRGLEQLPDTDAELRAIAKSLQPGSPPHLLMRDRATKSALMSMDLRGFDVLVFATHGLTAEQLPATGQPALVLTPSGACGPTTGLLTSTDVAQLRLDADWVVLSACNTAAGDGSPGTQGLSGLARAFLYSGARALLVSHWSINSEVTVELTTSAFESLAKNPGQTKAEALRAASLAVLRTQGAGYRAHPYYWAPFVLVGGLDAPSKP